MLSAFSWPGLSRGVKIKNAVFRLQTPPPAVSMSARRTCLAHNRPLISVDSAPPVAPSGPKTNIVPPILPQGIPRDPPTLTERKNIFTMVSSDTYEVERQLIPHSSLHPTVSTEWPVRDAAILLSVCRCIKKFELVWRVYIYLKRYIR